MEKKNRNKAKVSMEIALAPLGEHFEQSEKELARLKDIAAKAREWQKRAERYFQLSEHGIIALAGADKLLEQIANADLGGE